MPTASFYQIFNERPGFFFWIESLYWCQFAMRPNVFPSSMHRNS